MLIWLINGINFPIDILECGRRLLWSSGIRIIPMSMSSTMLLMFHGRSMRMEEIHVYASIVNRMGVKIPFLGQRINKKTLVNSGLVHEWQ